MKRLIVKYFFRFRVERGIQDGKYWIAIKAPFKKWSILAYSNYPLMVMAKRQIKELRNYGADLFDAVSHPINVN